MSARAKDARLLCPNCARPIVLKVIKPSSALASQTALLMVATCLWCDRMYTVEEWRVFYGPGGYTDEGVVGRW